MKMNRKTMVRGFLALALPTLFPIAAKAEPLILEAQAPATTAEVAVPQQVAVDPQIQNEKILVLPFQPVDPNESKPWIGKSIQQSMVADLMALAPDHIVTSDQFAVSVEAAIALGQHHGARYVVAGGYLTTDKELRVTGELLDAQTGKAVTGLKVTGDLSQVFHMEDGLAIQVRAKLFPASLQAPPAQASPQAPAAPQGPDMVAVPQPQPSAAATAAAIRNDAGYVTQVPSYSTYAAAPAPTVYGANPDAYTYYPTPTYDAGVYPDYSGYYPYDAYPYYYPGYGLGLGFYFGGYGGYGRGYRNYGGYGRGYGGYGGRGDYGGRSSYAYRGGASYSTGISAARSFAPNRAQSFSSGSVGRGMSAFRGGSFGGGGFHGGGGGASHGGGGGHR